MGVSARFMKEIPKFVSAVMERKLNPKPILRITKPQWEMLLERITKREMESVRINPAKSKLTEMVMGHEPPVGRAMGRINEPIMSSGEMIGRQPRDYSYPEAAIRYLRGLREGKSITPGEYVPPADVLRSTPSGTKYERQVWKPIEEPVKRSEAAARAVQNEPAFEREPGTEDYISQVGELKKRGERVLESVKKVNKKKTEPPSEDLVKMGMLGDRLWKYIGGKRTITGRYWNALRENSRGRYKVQDPRDYFIRSFLRWSQDAEGFAKTFPNESKSLQKIWDEFQKEFGEEMVR